MKDDEQRSSVKVDNREAAGKTCNQWGCKNQEIKEVLQTAEVAPISLQQSLFTCKK